MHVGGYIHVLKCGKALICKLPNLTTQFNGEDTTIGIAAEINIYVLTQHEMEESAPVSSPQELLVEWAQDTSRQRQRRQVRFNEEVRYRIIEDMSRMSSEEIHSTWYQEEDFDNMRRDTKKSVKCMRKGYPEDNATRSYRGLEHLRSQDVLLSLQEERERQVYAVLRRQDEGATPHDLASTASRLSQPSADRASRRGMNDAM
jgi:hypothetical protein